MSVVVYYRFIGSIHLLAPVTILLGPLGRFAERFFALYLCGGIAESILGLALQ